jgi:hypothetical protein
MQEEFMPEREMNPNAGNARRFRITANAGETAIEINLPATLPKNRQPNQYKIVKKDIPSEARNKIFRSKTVIWINNYGIRLRGNFGVKKGGKKQDPFIDEVEGEQFSHEVIVPGPAPEGHPTLVYFDGTNVQPAGATMDGSGNYHFNLNIGDPAAGWGGG